VRKFIAKVCAKPEALARADVVKNESRLLSPRKVVTRVVIHTLTERRMYS
jgi:hypothetical protein